MAGSRLLWNGCAFSYIIIFSGWLSPSLSFSVSLFLLPCFSIPSYLLPLLVFFSLTSNTNSLFHYHARFLSLLSNILLSTTLLLNPLNVCLLSVTNKIILIISSLISNIHSLSLSYYLSLILLFNFNYSIQFFSQCLFSSHHKHHYFLSFLCKFQTPIQCPIHNSTIVLSVLFFLF